MTLYEGHNSTKGDNSDVKKIHFNYFLMRNIYIKFKLYLNKFCNGPTEGWMDGQNDAETSPNQYVFLHKNGNLILTRVQSEGQL